MLQSTDVCLINPEMLIKSEFEANEETNKMTNEESEGDKDAQTLPTTQANTKFSSI
jgi:hypothetical protein